MTKAGRFGKPALLLQPTLFWLAAFALPMGTVMVHALKSPEAVGAVLNSPYYRGILGFTAKQAWWSTVFSVLLGLPGAFLMGRFKFAGRRFLRALSTVPFVLPPILAVLGFVLVFGNAGLLNRLRLILWGGEPWKILYSLKAIILAHVFYNFPITLRLLGDAWAAFPMAEHRAASSLGASPVRIFLTVGIPRLMPALLTSALITFLYCFFSFAIVLVLGGGPMFSTMEVEVYRLVKHALDFERGSALALIESVCALVLIGFYAVLTFRMRFQETPKSPLPPKRLKGIALLPALFYQALVSLLILAPLFAVAVEGFLTRRTRSAPAVFTLEHWRHLFGDGMETVLPAMGRTLGLGLAVSLITVTVAATASRALARRRGILPRMGETLLLLPMGGSSIILALGYLILAGKFPRVYMVQTVALAAAHVVIALPFAHRIIAGRIKQLSPRLTDAACALGASPGKAFRQVELPLIRRALTTAAVFALALSAGELSSTLILAPPGFTTVSRAIYQLVGSYNVYAACALGTILIILCTLAFLTLDRFGEVKL